MKLAAIVLLAGMAGPSICEDKAIWASWLQREFNQYYAFSLTSNNYQIEVWIDPVEGDWTFLGDTGTQYCLVVAGNAWPEDRR
jgi:hypothetical protein